MRRITDNLMKATLLAAVNGTDEAVCLPRKMIEEIITELESHEPRPLTLDEVRKLRRNDVVWICDKGNPETIAAIVTGRDIWLPTINKVTGFIIWNGCKINAPDLDYMKCWCCWTSRPTDEQVKNVQWETRV